MDRHEKASMSAHRKCQICLKQANVDCIFTDVAHYAPETGNLTIVSRLACTHCRQQILSIRQYVEENGLSFSKSSTTYKEFIEPYLPKDQTITINDENTCFQTAVEQDIKRNKLYHCAKLPQNCLQLVYYSSFAINHAQRHERIRNTIGQVMKAAPIPYGNLEDIAVLVHCLSCYMHEHQIILLLKHICERILTQGSPINPSQLISELPAERIWKELYSECFIGNVAIIIGIMLRDWKNFDSNFQKLRQYRGYLKKQKINSVLAIRQPSPSVKKKLSLEPEFHDNRHQHGGCKQCKNNKLASLINQARMKNSFVLTLKNLLKQDTNMREHIGQIELKFLKEKSEFINKIIKLKDKIQLLQRQGGPDQQFHYRKVRSASQWNVKTIYKPDLEEVSQKSEGTCKTVEVREKIDENIAITNQTQKQNQKQVQKQICKEKEQEKEKEKEKQIEKPKSSEPIKQNYLHRLIANIPEFDPSFFSQEADDKSLVQKIQNSIIKMKDEILALEKKCRSFENQSKRLLSILTRKQQQFVPLIHEKDQIIQKYQNALWRMQHNLQVEDPSLAPRIEAIITTFNNNFMQSMSNGTFDNDRGIDEPPVMVTPVKSGKKKDKEKKKQKSQKLQRSQKLQKSQKKLKSDEKQCVIF